MVVLNEMSRFHVATLAVQHSFVRAFRVTSLAAACLAALSAVCALVIRV